MNILVKLLGIIFPVVLFLFRYILPTRFEKALTKTKRETKQVITELIHFPNEMLMISAGYTIPKMIEYLQLLSEGTERVESVIILLLYQILFSIIIIAILPFVVAQTKIIEKNYFKNQHKKVWKQSIALYVFCLFLIIVSLFFLGE